MTRKDPNADAVLVIRGPKEAEGQGHLWGGFWIKRENMRELGILVGKSLDAKPNAVIEAAIALLTPKKPPAPSVKKRIRPSAKERSIHRKAQLTAIRQAAMNMKRE